MTDGNKQWLKICLSELERSQGWGPASEWRNEDFDLLSETMFERTKVRLSLSTLRRLFGRMPYNNFPNAATLNALTGFLGYSGWRAFCQSHPLMPPDQPSMLKARKLNHNYLLIGAGIIILSAAAFVAAYYRRAIGISTATYTFTVKKVADGLPNSVVFNYEASAAIGHEVTIQQSWDMERTESVDPKRQQHTSIYFYPGYFIAKLLVDNQVVKQNQVSITTKGWLGIAEHVPMPVYFKGDQLRHHGAIGITWLQLARALKTDDFNSKWIRLENVRTFEGIDATNFELTMNFHKDSSAVRSLCQHMRLVVIGRGNALIIPCAAKGCISDLNLYNGDEFISGKNQDLSRFGYSDSSNQIIYCSLKNHMLTIKVNEQLAWKAPVHGTLGKIEGINVESEGPGEIASMVLATPHVVSFDLMK